MLNSLLLALRFLILVFSGHRQVAFGKRRTSSSVGRFQPWMKTKSKMRPRCSEKP